MDTKALEKFCPWARARLIEAVEKRCLAYGLDDAGRAAAGPEAEVVAGRVLSPAERSQRAALYERVGREGHAAFCEAEAYGWFNRFVAIRYMELHGYLPCGVRMLSSAADGSFDPDCLKAPGTLELPGLDAGEVVDLALEGDHEAAFRLVLVAQCNQLAAALPDVFGAVSAADALTLPDGLLLAGEHNVLYRLVTDVPEQAWESVEALGWSYQFYNSERKDDFFNSKRKAAPEDIAPATQLFTPEWIVRYMVENSLGRLWMLNHPQSPLRDRMAYYIEPEAGAAEDFLRVSSPEDITVCDPACGSGHILSYAFELLMAMYEEMGYREREIPSLILTKNLSGMEIDPRAAQIASLVLAMRAREHDRRFLTRQEAPKADITVLQSVPLAEGDLTLCGKKLPEALTHLGEVGSLLAPSEEDVENLRAELGRCEGDLLDNGRANRVAEALGMCESLARRFDVVVANPPYMGSSNFNPFMSKWVKVNYPDVKSDLCTCFIERGFGLAKKGGYAAMVTMQSWMFLGSFEKMRERVIRDKGIVTMAHLGPRAFDAIGGEVVSVTADVIYNDVFAGEGTYMRLVDVNGSEPKCKKLVEAIQNPDCGWLYCRDAQTFTQIPGTPIAYWVGEAAIENWNRAKQLAKFGRYLNGMSTGKNEAVLREWFEVSRKEILIGARSEKEFVASGKQYTPYNKGGDFRKWYGNQCSVIAYDQRGNDLMDTFVGHRHNNPDTYFLPSLSWSKISSGHLAMRAFPSGFVYDVAGCSLFIEERQLSPSAVMALYNSSTAAMYLQFLCPTLNFEAGQIKKMPWVVPDEAQSVSIEQCSKDAQLMSKTDWDSFETSWDFKRHPLL